MLPPQRNTQLHPQTVSGDVWYHPKGPQLPLPMGGAKNFTLGGQGKTIVLVFISSL